jgi:hypothetical protein
VLIRQRRLIQRNWLSEVLDDIAVAISTAQGCPEIPLKALRDKILKGKSHPAERFLRDSLTVV